MFGAMYSSRGSESSPEEFAYSTSLDMSIEYSLPALTSEREIERSVHVIRWL